MVGVSEEEDNGGNTAAVGLRQTLRSGEGEQEESCEGRFERKGPRNEKLPFGPRRRIALEMHRHFIKAEDGVGDGFERGIVKMPDRISFNPMPSE